MNLRKELVSLILLSLLSFIIPSLSICFEMHLRHINSYSGAFRNQCLEVCRAVEAAYGADYTPAIQYLRALAANRFYRDAVLPPLPWLSTPTPAPGVGAPMYDLHPTVVQSLAPSIPLRAMFGGRRNI